MQDTIQTVSHYALTQKLSHKAGRKTFLATDLRTHTPVIVKTLQLNDIENWSELKLFQRESQILQQLSHPAIPKLYETFESDIDGVTNFVSVQSYIAAKSLQDIVESGKLFSEAGAIALAQKLLSTLSYLHSQLPLVVHRDIKPSNVLMSEPSRRNTADPKERAEFDVYLIDFGAVQITANKTSGTMTIVGSYGYMPLEQFLGQTTAASDLYSLGMLLLYLVTGVHPTELPERNGRIQIHKIAELAGLSDRFAHWLSKLIEPHAEKRFSSADVALTALTALTAKDGKNGYFPHLKPTHHCIHVHRKSDELTLVARSYVGNPIRILGDKIPYILFLGIFLYLFFALTILFIPIFIVSGVIFNSYENTPVHPFISIHRTNGIQAGTAMAKDVRIFRLFKRRKAQSQEAINFVSYRPKQNIQPEAKHQRFFAGSDHWHLSSELSFHTSNHRYRLPFHGSLSQQEQQWLSQEIEDFTGIKLQIIQQPSRDSLQNNQHVPQSSRK